MGKVDFSKNIPLLYDFRHIFVLFDRLILLELKQACFEKEEKHRLFCVDIDYG